MTTSIRKLGIRRDGKTMGYTTQMLRVILALAAAMLIVSGCGGSDEAVDTDEAPAAATEPANGDGDTTDQAASAAPASWADVLPERLAEQVGEACPNAVPTAASDLWPGLDGTVDGAVEELLRGRTAFLVQANPKSCQGLTPADSLVTADAVGAAAARGFTHGSPELRYDIFVFAGSADDARASVTDAITAAAAADASVTVSKVGQSILVARSHSEAFEARSDGDRILSFYSQLLAGTE